MPQPSASGLLGWLPWVGGAVALAVAGGVLGVTGVFGHPIQKETVAVNSILMPPTVQAESCPGGPVVASVERGSRIVAIARNADGTQVQVRNPGDVSQLVWVSTSQVDADSGQVGVSELPLGPACPTLYVEQPTVVKPVTPATPVTPTKPKPKPKPKDTTAPALGKPTATFHNCGTTINVTASDNVRVTSVSISWSGTNTGSGSMTPVGGGWQYTESGFHDGSTTFAVTAHDAAGNVSPTNSVTTSLQCVS